MHLATLIDKNVLSMVHLKNMKLSDQVSVKPIDGSNSHRRSRRVQAIEVQLYSKFYAQNFRLSSPMEMLHSVFHTILTLCNKGAKTRALSTHLPVKTMSAPRSRALLIGPAQSLPYVIKGPRQGHCQHIFRWKQCLHPDLELYWLDQHNPYLM